MRRVLIADDAAFMRTTIKMMLVKNGYTVVGEAVDGNDVFLKYKELKPDIVTMDITMPNCSGLEALKTIMEYDTGARVIMLTAMGQQGMVVEAINLGAKSFIIKPFREETVMKALNSLS